MRLTACTIVCAVMALAASPVHAAISFTGPSYTQDFDTLATTGTGLTWTNDSTLAGWFSDEATYNAGTGSSNTGSLYSFGAAASTERALGGVSSGTPGTIYFGAQLVNNTAEVLTSFSLSYTGEQWRSSGAAAQTTSFSYKLNAVAINDLGGYTTIGALGFTSPTNGAAVGALDGNAAANQAAISSTVTGLNWTPGSSLWVRWVDTDDSGTDHGLAIDNLTFSAAPAANIRINEVDSDTPGSDALEFVELYDGGVGNTPLDGLVLVFFNGATDTSYRAMDLDGLVTDANGFFVVGNSGVPGVGLTFPDGTLQNGADAVALYALNAADFPNGTAVSALALRDAIVYGTNDADDTGLLAAFGGPQIDESGLGDSAVNSIGRYPNFGGAWFTLEAPSPGALNFVAPAPAALPAGLAMLGLVAMRRARRRRSNRA